MTVLPQPPQRGDAIRAEDMGAIIAAVHTASKLTASYPITVDSSDAGHNLSMAVRIARLEMVVITEKVPVRKNGKAKFTKWNSGTESYEKDNSGDEFVVRDVTSPGLGEAKVDEFWWATIGQSGDWELVNCGCSSTTTP